MAQKGPEIFGEELEELSIDDSTESIRRTHQSFYRPLNKDRKEIRLLIVKSGEANDPVSCTLRHKFLSDDPKPSYETISYVWGDKSKRGSISLEGTPKDVPLSAEIALRRMRFPDKARVLWIDAVCINQEDLIERGHQVSIMYEVYSNTMQNLIWLGPDDGHTARAQESLRAILNEACSEMGGFQNIQSFLWDDKMYWRLAKTGFSSSIELLPLWNYFSSPWFCRLWVVQEALLAKRSVCIRGDFASPFEDVLRACCWIQYKIAYVSSKFARVQGWKNMSSIQHMANPDYSSDEKKKKTSHPTLLTLLQNTQNFNADDPKDHVYGVLGLFRKYSTREKIPDEIVPDYTKPLGEILKDVTRFIIHETEDLRVLHRVTHHIGETNVYKVPSWACKWHKRQDRAIHPSPFHLVWRADHGHSWESHNNIGEQKSDALVTKGITVTSVSGTTEVMWTSRFDSPQKMIELIALAKQLHYLPGVSNEKSDDVVGATLVGGAHLWREPLLEGQGGTALAAFLNHLDNHHGLPPALRDVNESTPEEERLASQFRYMTYGTASNRRFFRTSSGQAGLGPQTMEAQDVVAILYGCSYPVILRPSNEHKESYEFVGTAYVHGIMNGEAVRQHKANGRADETFCLV